MKTGLNLSNTIQRGPTQMILNQRNWKIKALNGYETFLGVIDQGTKHLLEIKFTDDSKIQVTPNHVFLTPDNSEVLATDLKVGDVLASSNAQRRQVVRQIHPLKETAKAYDIFESESNTYYSNGVLSHNCEFLSAEVTLIDSYILNQIEEKMDKEFAPNGGDPPVALSVGELDFFKKINRDMTYLVGVDVASGNGNDYSVITVVEFPTMEQVLEFRSNKLSEQFLYARLKNVLLFLQQNCEEVYFSVENNGIGASVLALYEFDTNPPRSAYLISEENNKRMGLAMSEATKKRAAMKFKNMIETETYKFYSLALLEEMKSYTRQGATYKAEAGATDDSIAAHLIIMRIIEEMAEYNPHAYDKIYNTAGYDEQQSEWDSEFVDEPKSLDDMPMPISLG